MPSSSRPTGLPHGRAAAARPTHRTAWARSRPADPARALEPHPDAPVLRRPSLGDVQLGEQLDARNDGRLEALRWTGQLGEHAVHPEPRREPVSPRFKMDIGRPRVVASRISRLTNRMTGGWLARSRASASWSSAVSAECPSSASRSLITRRRIPMLRGAPDALEQSVLETETSSSGMPYESSKSSSTSRAASPATATRSRSPATSRAGCGCTRGIRPRRLRDGEFREERRSNRPTMVGVIK